jgi:peptidoglycan biosynthesis protein MviN/MurJ (putative lipid II flippase)
MALAYSASYMLAAAIALRSLQRRVSVPLIDAPTRASISSVALATVAMAGLVAIVAFAPGGDHGWAAILRLGVGVLAGGALYFAVATKLGVDELGPITDRLPRPLRNKLTKQPSSTPEPPGRTEEHLGR